MLHNPLKMTKVWVTLIANDSVAIYTALLKPRMSNIFHSRKKYNLFCSTF